MTRIKQGWALTKKSWSVLKQNRELIRFPVYGGIATILVAIVVLGPGLYLINDDKVAPGAPLVIIGFYVMTFLGIYFSVGLAAAADRIFRGEQAGVAEGMEVARSRIPQIAGWAGVSATVGVVLSILQEQGIIGEIISRLLAIGWALVTFLAVPVIAIEGLGPGATFKRSTALFRQKWGQQVSGNLAIGGAVFLIALIPVALLFGGAYALWNTSSYGAAVLGVLGIAVLAIAMLIARAVSGIFGVALYRYAVDGEAVGGFTPAEFDSAVRRKRGAASGTI